ncbi:MAG: DNA-directed RNA polymerase subunit alpha [Planctomycetes bacterium]|nr:DNA-directed RNA polymerase subunit alpha [Planctomycetota bacterium]
MRIRWRGLELPGRVVPDSEVNNDSYGRFKVEPFEQGFGTTIGNSLRRVLLSCLEGAAVTTVKIEGVAHEFATIDGVLEDVTDILLNVKGIILKMDGQDPKTMSLERDTAGEIKAGDFLTDPAVTIVNPDHLIATLTTDVPFKMLVTVQSGRGYVTASDNRPPAEEVGVIPVDSGFSPVRRVRYKTEAMRVGQKTNYDRLILEVWTDGSVIPEDAIIEAGMILRKHLNPFVLYHQIGVEEVPPMEAPPDDASVEYDEAIDELLDKPVSALNLSVRANNCLEAARVDTIRELVVRTESDLLRVRSFGKTSLNEVYRKLEDLGLRLGMRFGESAPATVADPMTPPELVSLTPDMTPEPLSPQMPIPPPEVGEEGEPTTATEADGDAKSTADSGPMAAFTMED